MSCITGSSPWRLNFLETEQSRPPRRAVSFAARMELRHLRYVVTLAETRHFGRAGGVLRLGQPPLSHQIRQLEEELRIKLFHRTKRQVQLTEVGRMFVQEARVILSQASHAASPASRVE